MSALRRLLGQHGIAWVNMGVNGQSSNFGTESKSLSSLLLEPPCIWLRRRDRPSGPRTTRMWPENGAKVCSSYVLGGNFARIRFREAANAARDRRRRPSSRALVGKYNGSKWEVFTSDFPIARSTNTGVSSISDPVILEKTDSGRPKSGKCGQKACKPGSVPAGRRRGMAIHLGRPSPDASRDLPGQRGPGMEPAGKPVCRPYSILLPAGFALPPPLPAARCALTAPFHPCPRRGAGGLLSAALSLRSPSPGVTRRRIPVEPGLSSPAERCSAAAAIRPSDRRRV